jgi:hypothetical protein
MGMWSTTGNISRIIAKLEWKFGDVGMPKIRADSTRRARFDGTAKLHEIARMFRVWPGDGPNASKKKHAKLWYGFLKWLHTQDNAANSNMTKVGDDIISLMRNYAVNDTNCRAIKFVAVEDADVRVSMAGVPAPLSTNANAFILTIILQTKAHGNDQVDEPTVPDDPPGEDVPDPDDDTSLRGARAVRAAAKTAKKKAAKKKVAKKKAAKKKH